MDDMRRPQPDMQRRDYSMPQPARRPMDNYNRPAVPQTPQPPAPRTIPVQYMQPQAPAQQPQTQNQAVFQRPTVVPAPSTPPTPHPKPALLKKTKKPLVATAALAAAAGLFAGGYILKSSGSANTLPVGVVKEAKFNVYFPSPMPKGYTYMKDTATFQIGQVFYKFVNGAKRVTVREEPAGDNKPSFSLLSGYQQFDSPVGKAAIGSTFGQPTAIVVTDNTLITMNSSGGVSPADLKAAIASLKNIGQNDGGKNGR